MPEGLGVSPGRTAGPVFRMAPPPALPADVPAAGPDDAERAVAALRFVADDLAKLAAGLHGAAAEVLDAESMIAADRTLADAVAAKVASGRPAAWAVTDAIADQQEVFASLGGYFAERAADLADIRDRAVARLLDLPMPGLPRPGEPYVLVADDLAPADTVLLDPTQVLAIVTRRGGPTSHTAILARSRGLPAVVGCALDVPDGTVVAVDGTTGVVEEVSASAAVEIRAERERARASAPTGPGRTADGHSVPLLGNVGSAADVSPDTEGIGLFRTEFLFLGRTTAPTVEEQARAYAEVFRAQGSVDPGGKIVVRTLDAGADKPLPFLGLAAEENPALGVRGLRVARSHPTVLADQLAAVALAASETGADVWVMAPMVATVAEAESFVAVARAAGLPVAGAMIEVPAAALQAARLMPVVDFVSIGTNDLSQYTMAADRMNGDLADLLDPWQPAVLELVAACARAGREAGKPVGVCGESAGDPLLALVFVGLGVTSLSMSGPSVAAVRASLASHTLADCQRLAEAALAAPTAKAARAVVAAG